MTRWTKRPRDANGGAQTQAHPTRRFSRLQTEKSICTSPCFLGSSCGRQALGGPRPDRAINAAAAAPAAAIVSHLVTSYTQGREVTDRRKTECHFKSNVTILYYNEALSVHSSIVCRALSHRRKIIGLQKSKLPNTAAHEKDLSSRQAGGPIWVFI